MPRFESLHQLSVQHLGPSALVVKLIIYSACQTLGQYCMLLSCFIPISCFSNYISAGFPNTFQRFLFEQLFHSHPFWQQNFKKCIVPFKRFNPHCNIGPWCKVHVLLPSMRVFNERRKIITNSIKGDSLEQVPWSFFHFSLFLFLHGTTSHFWALEYEQHCLQINTFTFDGLTEGM